MPLKDSFAAVIHAVEVLVAESMQCAYRVRIVHRFRPAGAIHCLPGEEVFAAFLIYRGREYQLRLSLIGRLLLDYLSRHQHCTQSASQIAAGIQASEFYRKHATHASSNKTMYRRVARSSIKVYIARLRLAFATAFEEAGINLDPREIVLAEETVTNEVGYRFRASVEWFHIDQPA